MTQEEIRKLLKTCESHINQVENDETALRDLSEVVHKVLTDSTRAIKLNACAVAAWALHIPVWGFAASKLWNWFLAIGPIPTIGVFHAAASAWLLNSSSIPPASPTKSPCRMMFKTSLTASPAALIPGLCRMVCVFSSALLPVSARPRWSPFLPAG